MESNRKKVEMKLEHFYGVAYLRQYAYLIVGLEVILMELTNPEIKQYAEDNWFSIMDALCEAFQENLYSITSEKK